MKAVIWDARFVLSFWFSLLRAAWHEKRWNHQMYFRAKRHAEMKCPCWYGSGLQWKLPWEVWGCIGAFICIIQCPWLQHQAEQQLLSALLWAAHFTELWSSKHSQGSPSSPAQATGQEHGAKKARLPKSMKPWTWLRSWPYLTLTWDKWEIGNWVWSSSQRWHHCPLFHT